MEGCELRIVAHGAAEADVGPEARISLRESAPDPAAVGVDVLRELPLTADAVEVSPVPQPRAVRNEHVALGVDLDVDIALEGLKLVDALRRPFIVEEIAAPIDPRPDEGVIVDDDVGGVVGGAVVADTELVAGSRGRERELVLDDGHAKGDVGTGQVQPCVVRRHGVQRVEADDEPVVSGPEYGGQGVGVGDLAAGDGLGGDHAAAVEDQAAQDAMLARRQLREEAETGVGDRRAVNVVVGGVEIGLPKAALIPRDIVPYDLQARGPEADGEGSDALDRNVRHAQGARGDRGREAAVDEEAAVRPTAMLQDRGRQRDGRIARNGDAAHGLGQGPGSGAVQMEAPGHEAHLDAIADTSRLDDVRGPHDGQGGIGAGQRVVRAEDGGGVSAGRGDVDKLR